MIRTALSWLKGEAAFLVLLAVCAAAAWLYVDYRHVLADRDDLVHRVEVICTAAGAEFAASNGAGRGIRCKQRIADMVAFKNSSDQQTAKLLADAMAAHDARQSTDNQAARAAAEAARSAALRMEAADAEAERRNLVDRDWFAAVNGVAGLRPAPR